MKKIHRYNRAAFNAALSATLAAAVLALGGCGKKEAAPVSATSEEVTFAVTAYKAEASNLDDYLEFGGDVLAVSSVDVLPDASGKLMDMYVEVGDYVKKNQLMATVDPSKPGLYYEPSPVRAPVAGTVSSFPLSRGATVSPSTPIGKISSTSDVEISISVAERYVSRIKLGQSATLTFDAYPGETFHAKVTEVSPVLDMVTRSMTVKLRLDPKDSRVKIGMYGRVKLVTDTKENVIVVPAVSVFMRDSKPFVFIARSGTAELREVKVGLKVDDRQEIVSGISVGEDVITSGQTMINDGSRVNIVAGN